MSPVLDEAKLGRSEDQIEDDKMLRWRILMRTARGHAAMVETILGNGQASEPRVIQAYIILEKAEKRESMRAALRYVQLADPASSCSLPRRTRYRPDQRRTSQRV